MNGRRSCSLRRGHAWRPFCASRVKIPAQPLTIVHHRAMVVAVPSDLLTTKETAKALGVHRNTVARWVREGVLTPTVSGDRVSPRFARADVDRLLRSDTEASA